MPTDEQLAIACFAPERDESACTELYEKYRHIAHCIARRILDDFHEAEDALHDAWDSLLRHGEFEHFSNFRALLFKSVRNGAFMILRKRHTHREEFKVDIDAPFSTSDADDRPRPLHEYIEDKKAALDREKRILRRDIELVLGRELSPTHHRAYKLVNRNGLTHSKAAEILGCSTRTIQRAYDRVEEILIQYDLIPLRKKRRDNDGPSSS